MTPADRAATIVGRLLQPGAVRRANVDANIHRVKRHLLGSGGRFCNFCRVSAPRSELAVVLDGRKPSLACLQCRHDKGLQSLQNTAMGLAIPGDGNGRRKPQTPLPKALKPGDGPNVPLCLRGSTLLIVDTEANEDARWDSLDSSILELFREDWAERRDHPCRRTSSTNLRKIRKRARPRKPFAEYLDV